ncbi:MAG: protoheme IX farnesyltransferase [Phycisphaerales bacterium]|jgi:protoheme IX farnesyltransferase|nr:protoheme IX farnesyltransferase [Phycisphaerales bacterium]
MDIDTSTTVVEEAVVRPASLSARLHDYYELTKPRMNFLIVITTMVGFYMASRDSMQWVLLLHTLFGTALAASAAGVFNQLIERKYDILMPRTQNRPLPAGRMMPWEALWFGVALAIGGVAWLALFVNVLTALLGAFTIGSYVFLYTPMKRISTLNTVIGAVPGAIPPVMGWSACQGGLSMEALALFGILFMWQMPHFLAIAILYKDDYARGGFAMLPVVDPGLEITGRQIVIYALALIPISLMPPMLRMTGAVYFTAAVLLGLGFLSFGVSAAISKTRLDARKLFFASIIYLPLLLGVMMLDRL